MAVQLNNSVARAFAILDLFSEHRPELTAADVARALGLNTVTAHRFLRSLAAVGAIVAVSRGTYRLGFMFADLGNRVIESNHLAQVARPMLQKVTAAINEASMATVMENNQISCVAVAHSGRTLSVNIRTGTRMEAFCSANGKLWLAHSPAEAVERFLDEVPLAALTERTITDRDAFRAQLHAVRAAGYAINDGEREDGLSAVACPVISRTGRMVAGLSVFGPTSRMSEEVMDRARQQLRCAAQEIEILLYGLVAA